MGLFLAFSCNEEKSTEEKATTVTVDDVKMEDIVLESNYPATLMALKEVELRTDVVGYVTHIHIEDGQQVKRGQVLYEIDKSRYLSSLEQANSRLQIAKSNLERLERDVNRYERLKSGNAIAGQIYDDALTTLNNAKQELQGAQADMDNATTNLSYATIRAPFDGTVGFSSVRLGALVNPGQTLLNVISTDDPIGLDFFADERTLRTFLELRDMKEKTMQDSTFTLILPRNELYTYPGTIENIDRAVDPGTGTIRIRLVFPNPERYLKPGMNASLRFTSRQPEPKLTVPQKALVERLGETYVYIAEEGRAKQVTIGQGYKTRERIVVEKGLKEGQKVIISGVQKLTDGDAIQIKTDESL